MLTDNLLLGKTKKKERNEFQNIWTEMFLNQERYIKHPFSSRTNS